jgi:nucleotide-binding universal stress UspA family protein
MMGRIVVGIDGSTSSRHALAFALRIAEMKNDVLEVIHAWEVLPPAAYAHPAAMPTAHEIECAAWYLLAREVDAANVRSDLLGSVRSMAVQGRPSAVLIEASKGARFVAVGSGHDRVAVSDHLGAVALDVMRHASCPVVITPALEAAVWSEDHDDALVLTS